MCIATWYARSERSGDRTAMWTKYSAPVQTGPRAHPVTYAVGTGSYSEVKRPGLGIDQPPISSVEIKERVGLYV